MFNSKEKELLRQLKMQADCIQYLEKRINQLHKALKRATIVIAAFEQSAASDEVENIFRAAAEAAQEVHAEENAKQSEIEMLKRMWGAK